MHYRSWRTLKPPLRCSNRAVQMTSCNLVYAGSSPASTSSRLVTEVKVSEGSNRRKTEALGMPHGTAVNRLRKQVLFMLLKRHSENVCYRCGQEIESEVTLSLEHKIPWAGNPELFWDLNNIAFSHLDCNYLASSEPAKHGSYAKYKKGCRCELCKAKRLEISRRDYKNRRAQLQ